MKPRKRLLGRIWAQAYKDCFRLGHTRVLVTQKELDALLMAHINDAILAINDASNTPDIRALEVAGIREAPGIKATREAQGIREIADAEARMHELAVVPKDPRKLLSVDNAVVVTKERRREVLRCLGAVYSITTFIREITPLLQIRQVAHHRGA